jgi:Domain of unknown function (DUF3291)
MHLAQINIGRVQFPLEDPRMAEFVDNLDRVNALAERSEGFVWRLKDDTGNATGIAFVADPRIIVNMSVWESVASLAAFAYKTVHRRFVQRRGEWFEILDDPHVALWWIEEGRVPDPLEGRQRLSHLIEYGASPYAFSFSRPFAPTSEAAPLGWISERIGAGKSYRSCG